MIRPPVVREPPTGRRVTPVASDYGAEQQLQNLQAQFDLLKAQVRQAQQLNSLGTAATMIAHEVNNLLTPILSYARVAVETDDMSLHKKALEVTANNVEMLVAMSERVLQISATKPAKRECVSVRCAAEGAVASLCRDLSKDGIRFSLDADESITVWADRLQLQQILFNLFLNAREAMAPSHGGQLKVTAESRDGDMVVIETSNTGDPIPAKLLPYIFEPFQGSKTAGRDARARCSGLGLALCRDLVEENHGTISVASDLETGTTFVMTFPRSERCRGTP